MATEAAQAEWLRGAQTIARLRQLKQSDQQKGALDAFKKIGSDLW